MSLINDYLKKTQVEAPPSERTGDVPPALMSSGKTRDLAAILRVATIFVVVIIAGMVFLVVHSTTQKATIPPDLAGRHPYLEAERRAPAPTPVANETIAPAPKEHAKAPVVSVPPLTTEKPAPAIAVEPPADKPETVVVKKEETSLPENISAPVNKTVARSSPAANEYPPVRVVPMQPPVAARTVEVDQAHYYQLGLMAQQQGDFREAEKYYQQLLADDPAHLEALTNLSAVYILQNNYTQARTTLDRILRLHPHNTKALVNLGIISLKSGQPDSAERRFQEALSIDPEEQTALTNLAYLAKQQNNTSQLEGYYKKLLGIAPDNVEILFAYASLLEQGSRFGEASSLYRQCLELDAVKGNQPLAQQITERIRVLRSYSQRQ
jgi:Flp pilus assembly protein TadD